MCMCDVYVCVRCVYAVCVCNVCDPPEEMDVNRETRLDTKGPPNTQTLQALCTGLNTQRVQTMIEPHHPIGRH